MKKIIFFMLISLLYFSCSQKKLVTKYIYIDNYIEITKIDSSYIYTIIPISSSEDDRLDILDANLKWEASLDYKLLQVSGKARNSGEKILNKVLITAYAYDSKDSLISNDHVYLEDDELFVGKEVEWSIKGYDCDIEPTKVNIGYSYYFKKWEYQRSGVNIR